jgi:hypothetical protein
VRLASEVLPVVGIDTCISLVLFVTEGTPYRLEMEQVKVYIPLHILEHADRQLRVVVRKGANVAVVALIDFVGVVLAEFSFILLWMVKVLNTVVGLNTEVTLGTLSFLSVGGGAHF